MSNRSLLFSAATSAVIMMLCACGGGGGGGRVVSTPPPPTTPTPPSSPLGAWYDTSTSAQFTAMATGVEHAGSASGHVTSTITTAEDVRIEYSVDKGSYLVTLPGMPQGRLDRSTGLGQGPFDGSALLNSAGDKIGEVTLQPRTDGYTYANIASWTVQNGAADWRAGEFVFGTPTAAGDVPTAGSASYSGIIKGETNEAYVQSDGTLNPSTITGTMLMTFDFAAGTFSGHISPVLGCWACIWDEPLTPLHFTETVYSAGSTHYSGKFDTPLVGPNSFEGVFAGPNAVETMARFQAPYEDPYTGDPYQMSGVWVAKQAP